MRSTVLLVLGAALALGENHYQKIVFENEFVRVTDTQLPAGAAEEKHSHLRGVTIPLAPYDNETVSFPGETRTKRHTDFAEVRWAEPVTHEARNTGSTLQHVVRVELLKDAPAQPTRNGDSLDSVIAAKATQRAMFENAYVRVIEEKIPAGASEPLHRHGRSVLIPLSSADLEITDQGATPTARKIAFGDAGWREPVVHSVKNVGPTELRNIRVELK